MNLNDECWDLVCKDTTICLLKRFYYHSVECLKELGGDQYYDLLRPLLAYGTIAAAHVARNALQLEGNDVVSNARLVSFGHDYFTFGNQLPELYEKAVVKRTDRCVVQDGPAGACFHCRSAGVSLCNYINADHQMIVYASIPEGFRMCEYYIKEVGQKINGPRDYGKKIRDLAPNPLNAEQRIQLAREMLTWYTSFNLMAIEDNFGSEECQNRMRHRMWYEGIRFRSMRSKETLGGDVDISALIIEAQKILSMRTEVMSQGDTIEFNITSCPFSSQQNIFCTIIEMFFEGLCKGCEEGKELVQLERLTDGAPACRYILRPISKETMKWSDK